MWPQFRILNFPNFCIVGLKLNSFVLNFLQRKLWFFLEGGGCFHFQISNFTHFLFLLTCWWLQKAGFLYWGFWCKTWVCTKYGNILNGKKCTLGMMISNRKCILNNKNFERKRAKRGTLVTMTMANLDWWRMIHVAKKEEE